MSALTCVILPIILLISPVFAAAVPEPAAQVYEVQGQATVKSSADGSILPVKKGCLLALNDSLTLEKNASIAVYFKNGGRKEIRANDAQMLYKVADLLPRAEAYDQSVPMFGATRGIPQAVSQTAGFFYPQEAIILDSSPLIEFTLFHGSGEAVSLGGATVQIVKDGVALDSGKFAGLEYGSPYVFEPQKLNGQTEYKVELRLELLHGLGNVAISFPLYIAGSSDFSDLVYRSVESTSVDHKGKKRAIMAIKQLARRGAAHQPVIVIELFIP